MPFEFESAEAFIDSWFRAKNPASMQCMSNCHGSMEMARETVKKVVREDYANGKEIYIWAVLGIGKK